MLLLPEQIKEALSVLTGWTFIDNQIQKTYSLKDFETALKLVNQVAAVAENLNHHPDIEIRYNNVTFILSTHDDDGVTEKDISLAKEIEKTATILW